MEIHGESYQIYGAPKITEILQKNGYKIVQQTVSKYMNEEGSKTHYVKPYTSTTRDSDFSVKLKNVLNRNFTPSKPDAAWCSYITYV